MTNMKTSKAKLLDELVRLHIKETKYLHYLVEVTEVKKQCDKQVKRRMCIANSIVQGSLAAIDQLAREV